MFYAKTIDLIADVININGVPFDPLNPVVTTITTPGESYSSASTGAFTTGVFDVKASIQPNNEVQVCLRCTTAGTAGSDALVNLSTPVSAAFRPLVRQYSSGVLITNAGAQVPYGGFIEATGVISLFILTNGAAPVFSNGSLCAVGNTLTFRYPKV